MNCWSMNPSALLWIERPHDAGGAIAMAYNSGVQPADYSLRVAAPHSGFQQRLRQDFHIPARFG